MLTNKRIPTNVITYNGINCLAFWGLGDTAVSITPEEYLDYVATPIGYVFQETESRRVANKVNGEHIDFITTDADKWYKVIEKVELPQEEPAHEWVICFEETEAPEPEKEEESKSLEFESLFAVLVTLAHQMGVEKSHFTNKLDVLRSIYEKFADKGVSNPKDTIYNVVLGIMQLVKDDKIYPSVKSNKLTYNGSIWKFERTPDTGEYVSGDLYVNNNKVGTYNGLICRNTLSGWEEGALAIVSETFGNQAISLLKEDNGEWQLK